MTIIKELRLKLGLDPLKVSESVGISAAEYFDLERFDEELHIAASVECIARVASALRVKPSFFYTGSPDGTVSPEELASHIQERLIETRKTLPELEEEVGWNLAGSLEDPRKFLDFNADGLRDLCAAVGVNWLNVLDALIP